MFLIKKSLVQPIIRSSGALSSRLVAKPTSATFLTSFRNLFIQTVETPNENALKFLPSITILGNENETREFLSGREAACSPLVVKLFSIDGIKSIMLGSNFITVEKVGNQDLDWSLIKPEIFSILTEYLTNGSPIILEDSKVGNDVLINEDDDEVVSMIKELIFTRIRPAIQDDGGDIEFVKFREEDGTVFLKLMGACRSCDSSSVTLKNGIESMLKYYIEEVQAVEPIEELEKQEQAQEQEQEEVKFEAASLTPRSRDNDVVPPSL
ncbi:scaffold protein Nfu/NifU N terminal-domain-containing protein [Scheffersomyces coipomensis]|uniref:scaffold protein Nfu/NifU N terminal-domain-containing protein n=1 Tax=Scheffersomyces coipomensis TaxID=1788519 RepID=UPI00315D1943